MISHHPTLNLDPDLTLDGVLYNHCRYFKFNVYVLFCFGLLWVLCPNQSFQSKGFAWPVFGSAGVVFLPAPGTVHCGVEPTYSVASWNFQI